MKKLPEYTSDDNMFFYMNALVDLVNSQQEAIEKLERVITRETVRIATDDIIDALSGSEEPIEMVSKARYAEKLGIHDTHRTVTLRIPKAEVIAKKFHETYERLAPIYGYETRAETAVDWSDVPFNNRQLMIAVVAEIFTDLQKALDEVQPNE